MRKGWYSPRLNISGRLGYIFLLVSQRKYILCQIATPGYQQVLAFVSWLRYSAFVMTPSALDLGFYSVHLSIIAGAIFIVIPYTNLAFRYSR